MSNFNYNSIQLAGRLTADPELRSTNNGKSVAPFAIACSYGSGENRKTDFIDCEAWGKNAENISQYFRKGSAIFVVGALHIDTYTDRDGRNVKRAKVQVQTFQFVDSKGEDLEPAPFVEDKPKQAPRQKDPANAYKANKATPQGEDVGLGTMAPAPAPAAAAPVWNDDDLPF